MSGKLPYLNLGCGYHFHADWTNIDFVSTGQGVIGHNLLTGIPFPDHSFEVVYHSNILEHFEKAAGAQFLKECYRVLKPGGIIRIAVPNLQQIIGEYHKILAQLEQNPDNAYLKACYDWVMIELYDQTVRNRSGGNMLKYLSQDELINEDYVIERCGLEVKALIDSYRSSKQSGTHVVSPNRLAYIRRMLHPKTWTSKLRSIFLKQLLGNGYRFYETGKFRLEGEIHYWMYDPFSLKMLLTEIGFKNSTRVTAFESSISQWETYQLDSVDGIIRKPDSFFMEAVK